MAFQPGDNNYSRTDGPWNKGIRDWKKEICEVAARLQMCVVLPNKLTDHAPVRCSCPHGNVFNSQVHLFVKRTYCCRSSASKAHDSEQKRKAAVKRWSDPFARNPPQTAEANLKRSLTLTQTLKDKKEEGWVNPGWGKKPSEEERKLPGTLYLIRYLDESGIHFKLGITKLTLAERFRRGQLISIIHLHTSTLGECFDLEQSLLKWAKDNGHRYSSPTTTELIHPDGLPYLLDRLTPLCLP
jgi:hypothetical protein